MAPTAAPGRRQLVLVAGAGRSGTSLVTGLVGRLGFSIPLPEVKADDSNPKGFSEPRWAVDFHTRLLRQLAMTPEDGRPEAWELAGGAGRLTAARARLGRWLEEQLSLSDRVVVKDPRLTWFVGLWESVARDLDCDVAVLTMLRHPAESVSSRQLAYGGGSSPTTRTASWLNMMLGLEALTRVMPRAVVAYDALLTDWQAALTSAESGLGLPLVSASSVEEREAADGLVDTSLRRAAADWDALGLPGPVQQLAERSYAALSGLVDGAERTEPATLDRLRADYAELYGWAGELTRSRVRAARIEERRKAAQG